MAKIKKSDIAELIPKHKGNIAAVARALGVRRQSVDYHVAQSESLQKILAEERETMLDNAESVLYSKVLSGDMTALIFFLKTQGKGRGYSEKFSIDGQLSHHHSGSVSGEVVHILIPDNGREDIETHVLTTEELRRDLWGDNNEGDDGE